MQEYITQYKELMTEFSTILKIDTTDIRQLLGKMGAIERLLNRVSILLVAVDKVHVVKRFESLNRMVDDTTKKYNKVLASSTLTQLVVDAETKDSRAMVMGLKECQTNARRILDSTRTAISTEKGLIGV